MKETLKTLIELKESKKFYHEEWLTRGLNPPESHIVAKMNQLVNQFLSYLVEQIESGEELETQMIQYLTQVDLSPFDTEEREFIIDYFVKAAQICQIDINYSLNSLMYGKELADLILETKKENQKEKKIVQSFKVENHCEACDSTLICTAIEKQSHLSSIGIAKCWKCRKYSLYYLPEDCILFETQNFKNIDTAINEKENIDDFRRRINKLNNQ